MEMNKALTLLKQELDEISNLRKLPPDKKQYQVWFGKVSNILELTFGITSREYVNFARAVSVDYIVYTEQEKQRKYNEELDAYENALKSAINKSELLEAGGKPLEIPKLNKERQNEGSSSEDIRKHLMGMPEEIALHIVRLAESIKEENKYKIVEEDYNTTPFSKRLRVICGREVDTILVSLDGPYPDRHDVGIITLQSLPNNKTLFISEPLPSNFDSNGSYFGSFLQRLSLEFKNLGIDEATPEKILDTKKEIKMIGAEPKAFIVHGGRSGILDKLREFIEALGIKPVIVELSPTRGMTVDEKVNKYIKDADCGIVLATKGGIVDTTGNKLKQHPRLNVIDELERLRAALPEKTILLVERGVDLPSNISGLTYEPFVGQSMDRAFTAIARELTEFGILRAVKPLLEETKV